MSKDQDIDNLHEYFNKFDGQFRILEEQIDIDIQKKYFDLSYNIKNKEHDIDIEACINVTDQIFNSNDDDEIKSHLVQLASINDVRAYRIIEAYYSKASGDLKEWCTLAFQESRMLLESSLLEEPQVFISTGLGGKDNMIRYFIVLLTKDNTLLDETRYKVISNELDIFSKQYKSEIEDISFDEGYTRIIALIPIRISVKDFISKTITECNNYGDFLSSRFLVTNIKILSDDEIKQMIIENRAKKNQDKA